MTKLGTEPLLDLGSKEFLLILLLWPVAAAGEAVHGAAWIRAAIRGGAMPHMRVHYHDGPRFAQQQYLLRLRGGLVVQNFMRDPATAVRAGNHTCGTVFCGTIVQHQDRVGH